MDSLGSERQLPWVIAVAQERISSVERRGPKGKEGEGVMATYRERREAKADRLREWAAKREAKAKALRASTPDSLRHDWAFATQPGHIPERARMIARDDRAYENHQKGTEMASRAAGIEDKLEHAIYSDDPDAIQALQARIDKLEAERERMVPA